MNRRAVLLFSGGLDSILAAKLMIEQGIEIHALHLSSVFCTFKSIGSEGYVVRQAEKLNVPIKSIDITEEFMKIVKDPRYGRGSNMNPCIDCRIFAFKKAKLYMEAIKASFIVTGEVLGERPMSQTRHAIDLIERKSGLGGFIVRPLSAKLFKPSLAEKEGVIDRERLLDIQGRQRDKQFELARRFKIYEYPNPAGGCLLTDKGFSNRLKDLFKYSPQYDISDLHLLKVARQFRIKESLKLFVGRNQKENESLLAFSQPGDYIFDVVDIPSPIGLVRGRVEEEDIPLISSILARYSDGKSNDLEVSYRVFPSDELKSITTPPATEPILASLRI